MKPKQILIVVSERIVRQFVENFPRIHCRPIWFKDVEGFYPAGLVSVILFEDEIPVVSAYTKSFESRITEVYELKIAE